MKRPDLTRFENFFDNLGHSAGVNGRDSRANISEPAPGLRSCPRQGHAGLSLRSGIACYNDSNGFRPYNGKALLKDFRGLRPVKSASKFCKLAEFRNLAFNAGTLNP